MYLEFFHYSINHFGPSARKINTFARYLVTTPRVVFKLSSCLAVRMCSDIGPAYVLLHLLLI